MKICFVSPEAYPILAKTRQESVGGAEVQQVLIAKEIRRYGFNISFVVGDYGQKAIETINNMIVIRSFQNFYNSKLYRVLRFIPDMISLFQSLKTTDAEIYYLRCPVFLLGQVALFCKIYKRKLIFSATKDLDTQKDYIASFLFPINYLVLYGIIHADVIVAQNKFQKENFQKNFRRESIVIKNGRCLAAIIDRFRV